MSDVGADCSVYHISTILGNAREDSSSYLETESLAGSGTLSMTVVGVDLDYDLEGTSCFDMASQTSESSASDARLKSAVSLTTLGIPAVFHQTSCASSSSPIHRQTSNCSSCVNHQTSTSSTVNKQLSSVSKSRSTLRFETMGHLLRRDSHESASVATPENPEDTSTTTHTSSVESWVQTFICQMRTISAKSFNSGEVMSRDLRPQYLRGVGLQEVLAGFGRVWDKEIAITYRAKKVHQIHFFISHDWQTRRVHKSLALCLIFNSRAALWASIAVTLLTCVLSESFLPQAENLGSFSSINVGGRSYDFVISDWAIFSAPVSFMVVFFSWQRIRSMILRWPVVAFVDRLCINQSDMREKEQGIRSLAGVLKYSQRLLILWSPQYFTRLWCAYELASWLYLGRELGDSVFMPVVLASCLVLGSMTFVACWLLAQISWPHPVLGVFVPCLAFILVGPPLSHMLRVTTRDQKHMSQQLANFSIRDAKCFCCDSEHVDPVTGAVLRCDRALVYATLHRWWREDLPCSVCEGDMHLDAFDAHVRSWFQMSVTRAWSGIPFSFGDALFMSSPFAWSFAHKLYYGVRYLEAHAGLRYMAEGFVLWFAVGPLVLFFLFRTTLVFNKYCGPPGHRPVADAFQACSLAGIALAVFALLATSVYVTGKMEHAAFQIVLSTLLCVLVVTAFSRSILRRLTLVMKNVLPQRQSSVKSSRTFGSFQEMALHMVETRTLKHRDSALTTIGEHGEHEERQLSPSAAVRRSRTTFDANSESWPASGAARAAVRSVPKLEPPFSDTSSEETAATEEPSASPLTSEKDCSCIAVPTGGFLGWILCVWSS